MVLAEYFHWHTERPAAAYGAVRAPLARGITIVGGAAIALSVVTATPELPGVTPPWSVGVSLTSTPVWFEWLDQGSAQVQQQITVIAEALIQETHDFAPLVRQTLGDTVALGTRVLLGLTQSAMDAADVLTALPGAVSAAFADALADPIQLPAIVQSLLDEVLEAGGAIAAPTLASIHDSVDILGAHLHNNSVAISADLPVVLSVLGGAPAAISEQVMSSGQTVFAAIATLDPLNVIGALGQGFVDIEGALFNSVVAIGSAVRTLRDDLIAAMQDPEASPFLITVEQAAGSSTQLTEEDAAYGPHLLAADSSVQPEEHLASMLQLHPMLLDAMDIAGLC